MATWTPVGARNATPPHRPGLGGDKNLAATKLMLPNRSVRFQPVCFLQTDTEASLKEAHSNGPFAKVHFGVRIHQPPYIPGDKTEIVEDIRLLHSLNKISQ